MPWGCPVAVNFHEASAFAKWKSMKTGKTIRVMSELEHHAIRDPLESIKLDGKEFPKDPIVFKSTDSVFICLFIYSFKIQY